MSKPTERTEENLIKQLEHDCNRYDQNLQALRAISHEYMWSDKDSTLRSLHLLAFGRRLDTSKKNKVSPDTCVTPDLVLQDTVSHGVLAELKMSLPQEENYLQKRVQKTIKQIHKYDDDLKGWNTSDECVESHDIMLVVHQFRANDMRDALIEARKNGELDMMRPFALIGFSLVDDSNTYLALELIEGRLGNAEKEAKLKKTLPIRIDHLLENPLINNIELFDEKPPDPMLMKLIYDTLESQLTREQRLSMNRSDEVELDFELSSLRDLLAKRYGPDQQLDRAVEIPAKKWVREALKRLIGLGWIKKRGLERFNFIRTDIRMLGTILLR